MIADTNSLGLAEASGLLPPTIISKITDRPRFMRELIRYTAMENDDLLRATEVCLRNLGLIDDQVDSSDRNLQLILVPELWERIQPGTRDKLRWISSTLAEYNPDPSHPSSFRSILSPEELKKLRDGSDDLRQRIKHVANLDVSSLIEQVRFAIAGSRAADRWTPDACVYEPGFVYRMVPAVAWRAMRDLSPGATS